MRTLAARASSEERRFDRGSPALNLQLPGGERLFAVLGLTAGGVTALLDPPPRLPHRTLAQLRRTGTIDVGLEAFPARAGAGPQEHPDHRWHRRRARPRCCGRWRPRWTRLERLVTDRGRLRARPGRSTRRCTPTWSRCRPARPNIEGEGAVSQAELVRWALRMSPDRVIVGEIRGPEVIPMCNAMSQGNDGSHGHPARLSSSRIAFTRLAVLRRPGRRTAAAGGHQPAGGVRVHFVVHWTAPRTGDPGGRPRSARSSTPTAPQVVSNEVYRPGPDRRAVPGGRPLRTDTLDDLVAAGFDPQLLASQDGWWPRDD